MFAPSSCEARASRQSSPKPQQHRFLIWIFGTPSGSPCQMATPALPPLAFLALPAAIAHGSRGVRHRKTLGTRTRTG